MPFLVQVVMITLALSLCLAGLSYVHCTAHYLRTYVRSTEQKQPISRASKCQLHTCKFSRHMSHGLFWKLNLLHTLPAINERTARKRISATYHKVVC